LDAPFALGAVPVYPHNGGIRKLFGQGFFGALSALAYGFEIFTPASRAAVACGHLEVAVMATHGSVPAMVCQSGIAARAFLHVATIEAHHDGGESTPVHKYQCLLTSCQCFLYGVQGGARKAGLQRAAAYVEQGHFRWQGVTSPLLQPDKVVFALPGIVPGFQ